MSQSNAGLSSAVGKSFDVSILRGDKIAASEKCTGSSCEGLAARKGIFLYSLCLLPVTRPSVCSRVTS